MIHLPLFIIALITSQLICLWIARRSSKSLSSQEDYFLAKRTVRFFPLMMTFVATQIGGGLVLGAADEAYLHGWAVLCYPLGMALGLILLGLGVGKKLYALNLGTVAQIFELKYNSPVLRKIASILSMVSLFMIFVAQMLASKKFMLAIGLESPFIFYLFWGIVILYTSLGGLKAVISTDIIQAFAFIAIFLICLMFTLHRMPTSFFSILDHGSQLTLHHVSSLQGQKIFGWICMPLLFMLIEQDMGQRCFAADSYQTVVKSTLTSAGVILLFACIPIFFGVLAHAMHITCSVGESILVKVVQITSNPYCAALFACGILLIIISTADALLNAIASNLSLDFPFFSRQPVKLSKFITLGISCLGMIFSCYFNNIVDVLIQSYELSISCLLVPIVAALFQKKPSKKAAVGSLLGGALGFILFRWVITPVPREFLSLLLSLLGFAIGSLFATSSYAILGRKSPRSF